MGILRMWTVFAKTTLKVYKVLLTKISLWAPVYAYNNSKIIINLSYITSEWRNCWSNTIVSSEKRKINGKKFELLESYM